MVRYCSDTTEVRWDQI